MRTLQSVDLSFLGLLNKTRAVSLCLACNHLLHKCGTHAVCARDHINVLSTRDALQLKLCQ
jgi:hypothetical protein